MRMMKNNKNETIMVIGIDHGYGNMKTAKANKGIECRIRHMTVRYFASEWCTTRLFQKQKICRRGVFLFLLQSVLTPQNHCHLNWVLEM